MAYIAVKHLMHSGLACEARKSMDTVHVFLSILHISAQKGYLTSLFVKVTLIKWTGQ